MTKRSGGFDMSGAMKKIAKLEEATAQDRQTAPSTNRFLQRPVHAEFALQHFLYSARKKAWEYLPKELQNEPIQKSHVEIEARLGVLALNGRRVVPSGAKLVDGKIQHVFHAASGQTMASGISKTHFVKWAGAGISSSETTPITQALNATRNPKDEIVETEYTETVYSYRDKNRIAFRGKIGQMESKDKLETLDLVLPAAPYDLRVTINSEKILDPRVESVVNNWQTKRVKRRRSYTRKDKSIAWLIDVTEVTTYYPDPNRHPEVSYELEVELENNVMLQFLNEKDDAKIKATCQRLASQLWWVLSQLNPLRDALDVDETLQEHPNKQATQIARAQCGALRRFMEKGSRTFAVGNDDPDEIRNLAKIHFPGCMPVNFSRHNIEEIQRSQDNAYFLSEKTDGVRHLLVFTGDTAVLIDRKMNGKQPKSKLDEPFAPILKLFKPGTVLDGEVVMNRKYLRPVFIVFDVMMISHDTPVLHLSFQERLNHLAKATFRSVSADRDMFDEAMVRDPSVPLPLVRKNFVKRTELDNLLSFVVEEKGVRSYKNGDIYNHLTDGIIFQPNLPYVCGTDLNLLKWKYLDTVTIDLEIREKGADTEELEFLCLGEDMTRIDMTRYVDLPVSEKLRLEADRSETGGRIAEVGFDPETGEWYYVTIRADKEIPNHISTVLGSLFELSESLSTEELRYRMSLPPGMRDTYRKELKSMTKQLLDFHRKRIKDSKR